MDIKYQIFDPSGAPISSLVTAASNVPTSTAWSTGTTPLVTCTIRRRTRSAERNIVIQTIDTVTGSLSAYASIATGLADVIAVDARWLSNGNIVGIVEGFTGPGQTGHILGMGEFTPAGVQVGDGASFSIPGTSGTRWLAQRSVNDTTLVAFNNGSLVQLVELDSGGNQVGSTFTVPGITNFDRLRSLGDGRVELSYRLNGGSTNETSYGVIYDTRSAGQILTGAAAGEELAGTVGNDTITGGGGNDRIVGGGGTDTVVYSGNRSDYTVTRNLAADGVTVLSFNIQDNRSGSPDGTDTVASVSNYQFADQTVSAAALYVSPAPFTPWATLNPVFATANGTITDKNWARSFVVTRNSVGQGADPVIADMAAPAATFVNNGVNTYDVYLTAQNALGDQQAQSVLVGTINREVAVWRIERRDGNLFADEWRE